MTGPLAGVSRTCLEGGRPGRSTAPVVGVVVLLVLTVGLGAVVVVSVDSLDGRGDPTLVLVSASADSETNEITLEHRHGDPLDVTELELVVTIDGEELARQPPVPFFAADGFRGGPVGPFNGRANPAWRAGEVASFEIASTNDPTVDPGDEVLVTILEDVELIARVETTAE